MKKFMVTTFDPETKETGAYFFDNYSEARNFKMDMDCGLGIYCEIYERLEIVEDSYSHNEYVMIEA